MYKFNRDKYFDEYEEYYSLYPDSPYENEMVSKVRKEWLDSINDNMSSYEKKSNLYSAISRNCGAHIFQNNPFYFETISGSNRYSWGLFGGVGNIMLEEYRDKNIGTPFGVAVQKVSEGLESELPEPPLPISNYYKTIAKSDYIDWDHQSVGYDNVIKYGLSGLKEKAIKKLSLVTEEIEKDFLNSVIVGLDAMINIAHKFSEEATKLLKTETDKDIITNLKRIEETALRVPENPPTTFYEALETLYFMREVCASVDGTGISIFGMVDRILYPYYEADLKAGTITKEEVKELLKAFLYSTDARWNMHRGAFETSTTVVIGGQDTEGNIVYNDLTKFICEIFIELNIIGVKLNARITNRHPKEYLDLLSSMYVAGVNSLIIMNDEALIPSQVFVNKDVKDARLYIAGGCYEPMLSNCEVNFKAFMNLNLASVFETVFYSQDKFDSFEEFYARIIKELDYIYGVLSDIIAKKAKSATVINPCSILSATLDDCIENAKEAFAGGAKYNYASISSQGLGTLIDSMYSVKYLVFDKKLITWENLKLALKNNFVNYEDVLIMCKNVPKYGHEDKDVLKLAKQITEDIIRLSTGRDNGRGGITEPSFFTYYNFNTWGKVVGATPCGRLAYTDLSRGVSPKEESMESITSVINDNACLPMDKAPGCAALEVTLSSTRDLDSISAVIKTFVEKKGNMLQMSVIDKKSLLEAQKHPEKYENLSIRMCGYSAYFNILSPDMQTEVINRTAL